MNSARNCFVLPQNISFLPALAQWILQEYDTEKYAKILILLPNRRSCRALSEAFLDITGGKPMLLPRIQPIGEIEGETFFADITRLNIPEKQPIDPVRRHFLLMKLIMRFQQAGQGGGSMVRQAVELAKQLASLIDEVEREGLSFDRLSGLAPENLAEHWQKTLDFLAIITKQWPELLEEEGAVDIVSFRNQVLFALAEIWQKEPPDYPIIAAGSTGSQPATANLLKVIAGLPQGKVILPALDKVMGNRQWESLSESHPQYTLKKLLEKFEISREAVRYLTPIPENGSNDREKYLVSIFAPAEFTAAWSRLDLPDEKALSGIKLLEADTLQDEARAIAVKMRSVLEMPEKTAALITPDRALARMVCAQLRRFGIMVDDSAGRPLSTSAPACFLRLTVEMVASRFAPASLLALLRHPLAAVGTQPFQCRILSRELELLLLRGIRREEGIGALYKAAAENSAVSPELLQLLAGIEESSAVFSELLRKYNNSSVRALLSEHIKFAEWLSGTDTESGAQRLWAGEAGNALAELIAQWDMQAEMLPPIDATSYPALFDALLAGEIYHSQAGLYPRLHILSPMEARLQNYDVVILGSLNEGVWPKTAQSDPWMSRPQRNSFGLPAHEKNIGQSAHDFVMQLFAPEVLLTRARKVEGTPTIASRWWVRMQTLLTGRKPDFFASMSEEKYFMAAKGILEEPAQVAAIAAPTPRPPLSARPRKMRVTAIDAWLRDPYNIYARYILNLRRLDEIDREPDASDFGNLVHKALEIFTRSYPKELPSDVDISSELLKAGRTSFAEFLDRPAVACLWWPRFISMVNWLVYEEKRRRDNIAAVYSEVIAEWNFEVDDKPFSLSTRIDRLEQLKSGSYALIDYKTGVIPSSSDLKNGLSNQLPLEALIVGNGSLPVGIKSGIVSQMEYWKLSGNEAKCEIKEVESDIEKTKEILEGLIRKFDDVNTAYGSQTDFSLLHYNDYEHLSRSKEWGMV